jgi:sugar phosphate isomerase/epimerase
MVVIPAPAGRTAPSGAPDSQDEWLAGYQLEWDLAVDSLGRLASYATQQGVVLGLEPINRYETFLVNNIDQALRMIKEVGSEQLNLHLDTFHMNIDENDLPDAVRRAEGLLVNMHVSDSNREAPGRGHIDFPSLISALKETNYTGYLTLEPVPPGSDPLLVTRMPKNFDLRDVYAQESIAYLQKVESII